MQPRLIEFGDPQPVAASHNPYTVVIVVGAGLALVAVVYFRKDLAKALQSGGNIADKIGDGLGMANKAVQSAINSPVFNLAGKKGWGTKAGNVTGKKGWATAAVAKVTGRKGLSLNPVTQTKSVVSALRHLF